MQKLASKVFLPLVLAVLALGAMQSILRVLLFETTAVTLLDDAALALAALALVVGRFKRVPLPAWTGLGAWAALIVVAIARGTVSIGPAATAARQIAVPATLIVIGLALTRREWLVVAKTAFGIGVANGIYAVVEIVFGRLIDPGAMAQGKDRKPHGVPASYFWYDAAGNEYPRAGGLVLNAPVAGIVIAGSIILGWFLAKKWWQYVLVLLLVVPLYLTYSRSGMVLAVVGLLIPLLLRYAGTVVTALLGATGAVAGYLYFMSHGASYRHVEGLLNAFLTLRDHPLGQGFGTYGNTVARAGADVDGGESLVGLAVAALGAPGILMMLALVVFLVWRLLAGASHPTLIGMGLGLIAAAAFAESASALNGTAAFWIGAGYALVQPDPTQKAHFFPPALRTGRTDAPR